jgi:hypothetical protein
MIRAALALGLAGSLGVAFGMVLLGAEVLRLAGLTN